MEQYPYLGANWMEIDITNALREMYGNRISPDVQTVCMYQTDDRVWVTIRRLHIFCEAGHIIDVASVDLTNRDLVVKYDLADGEHYELYTVSPNRDVCINAENFVSDRNALSAYTSLFEH